MKNLKTGLSFALVLIILLIAFFVSMTLAKKSHDKEVGMKNSQGSSVENSSNNTNTDNGDPTSVYGTKTYVNELGGYTFDYPADLFQPFKAPISFPAPNGKNITANVDAFKHEIAVEHCALSGKCTPTTIDMSIGSTFRNETFDIKNYPNIDFVKIPFESETGFIYEYNQGVEGEGMVFTFIPQQNKLIIIYRTYIDENINLVYKKAKDFLPIAKQEEIYKKIINSLD